MNQGRDDLVVMRVIGANSECAAVTVSGSGGRNTNKPMN